MRGSHRVLLLLILAVFVYIILPAKWLDYGVAHTGIKYVVHLDQPITYFEYCQLDDYPLLTDEGAFHKDDFQLHGVVIYFRHGERSPLTEVKSSYKYDCLPVHEIKRRAFSDYIMLTNSAEFRKFVKVDSSFVNEPWHAHPHRCDIGQMTGEGTIRLIKLGTHLHEQYAAAGLFDEIDKADILISSSMYTRTFQSALAFLSTFFYVNKDAKEVHLVKSNTTYFCMDEDCQCPNYLAIRKKSELERIEEFQSHSSRKTFNRLQTLGNMIGMKSVEHPLHFLDVVLGRYVCRRKSLPCNSNDECVTVADLVEAGDETWNIKKRMLNKKNSLINFMFLIEANALLNNVRRTIEKARTNFSTTKLFRVYSGHDITLEPLMHFLNIKRPKFPPYSSRIVFELYKTSQPLDGETIFVRLLYNGENYTNNVPFCRRLVHGLCRGDNFEDFAKNGLLAAQKLAQLNEICT